ncbi:hypothetical protein EC912_106115 [Luteibacter rhizovicinus]|uniref:Prevent-host-death protein n=1 Tax=Luteibacter rhizovicinus TaxID=242606 RepID=A0A4R3YJY3_9GAMM|nr:YlcI/YnfO family protein [Luteibacter rhizovicinus]TCV92777.1 hypothetical protein EC912_106115 [Luteibacter rhizovicinus]
MKSATIPSLRVEPELREAAESVLLPDESLSAFVETALRAGIARRQTQRDFIARGMASRDEARASGKYFTAAEVHADLEAMLLAATTGKDAS